MADDLITAVERSKKGAVVTLNGEEKIFVSRALLFEREFTEGQSLRRDELARWLLPRQYPEALNLAVSLLAQRARSSGEIEQKLRDRFYLPETVEMVLYKLEKEHFLNDEAFATEYAAVFESPPDGTDAHHAGASPQGDRPRPDPAGSGIAGRRRSGRRGAGAGPEASASL